MILFYLSGLSLLILSSLFFFVSFMFLWFKFSLFMEWEIFSLNSLKLNMLIYIDWMTLMFIFTVCFISAMIMIYCCEYMLHDLYNIRFLFLMILFILSMIFLIISPNMVSMLVGWDGLGLVSYCLVIYYQNYYSYTSGMLTVLLNRIGDVFILISIGLMMTLGSWNYLNYDMMMGLLLLFIMVASFTKSAQFPFSSWLPAAMAAPTPVSSLVHSSTLVTAGVYLLIRFSHLIKENYFVMNIILCTGLITMMMAGFSAVFEYDLKKIIAFSTLSQLGLMMMVYGLGRFDLVFFHLVIHAMFKSMMFMCSGVFIHSMLNYQDIRFMGKLFKFMPLTCMMFNVASFSLCGMPFLSGFYSKDQILEYMIMSNSSIVLFMMMIISTMLTVIYSVRLSYYLMSSNFLFFSFIKLKDFKLMNYPMYLLMIFSVLFGSFMNWVLFLNIEYIYLYKLEKLIILFICLVSFFFGKMSYSMNFNFKNMYFLKMFMGTMWFLYKLNKMSLMNLLMFSKKWYQCFDKGWSEYIFKKTFISMISSMEFNMINIKTLTFLTMSVSYSFLLLMFIL